MIKLRKSIYIPFVTNSPMVFDIDEHTLGYYSKKYKNIHMGLEKAYMIQPLLPHQRNRALYACDLRMIRKYGEVYDEVGLYKPERVVMKGEYNLHMETNYSVNWAKELASAWNIKIAENPILTEDGQLLIRDIRIIRNVLGRDVRFVKIHELDYIIIQIDRFVFTPIYTYRKHLKKVLSSSLLERTPNRKYIEFVLRYPDSLYWKEYKLKYKNLEGAFEVEAMSVEDLPIIKYGEL